MKLLKVGIVVLAMALVAYLAWPVPGFPNPPPGAALSSEPADTESIYRRSYFTNLTRQEIMDYYFAQFGGWGLRLNHPPEEASTLIRDQTRSSYLEEIVRPGRESLYVNAFVPTVPSDQINIAGVHYLNKVTIRVVPSHFFARLTVLLLGGIVAYLLYREHALAA